MADDRQPPIITLTTDFGIGSRYIAAMKGVILTINPRATIVDLSHSVPPRDIRAGAIVLAETATWFPPDSIHVAVVDPGVGSNRRIVYARIGSQQFVAPDNGVLSRLAMVERPATLISIEDPRHWMPEVSRTFHGRDIMAPVAARLSAGLSPNELGRPLQHLVQIPWAEVHQVSNRIEGEVIEVDSFGNLITNITHAMLDSIPSRDGVIISCQEHETEGIFSTFSDQPPMTLMAHVGSTGRLELAIVDENASAMLGIRLGAPVRVTW